MQSEGVYRKRSKVPFEVPFSVALILAQPPTGVGALEVIAARGTPDSVAVFQHNQIKKLPVGSLRDRRADIIPLLVQPAVAPNEAVVASFKPDEVPVFLRDRRPRITISKGYVLRNAATAPEEAIVANFKPDEVPVFLRDHHKRITDRTGQILRAPAVAPEEAIIANFKPDEVSGRRKEPPQAVFDKRNFVILPEVVETPPVFGPRDTTVVYLRDRRPRVTDPKGYILRNAAVAPTNAIVANYKRDEVPFRRPESHQSLFDRPAVIIPAEAAVVQPIFGQRDTVAIYQRDKRQRTTDPVGLILRPAAVTPVYPVWFTRKDEIVHRRPEPRVVQKAPFPLGALEVQVVTAPIFGQRDQIAIYKRERSRIEPQKARILSQPAAVAPVYPVWKRPIEQIAVFRRRGPQFDQRFFPFGAIEKLISAAEPALVAYRRDQTAEFYRHKRGFISVGQIPLSEVIPPSPVEWTVAVIRREQKAVFQRRAYFEPQIGHLSPSLVVPETLVVGLREDLAPYIRVHRLHPTQLERRPHPWVLIGVPPWTSGLPEIIDIYVEIVQSLDIGAEISMEVNKEVKIVTSKDFYVER